MVVEIKYSSIDLESLLGRPLNDIEEKYAPEIIYYKGTMEIPLPCARVSIIGSRNASKKGLLEAEEITKTLIKNRTVIVSGLAKGIDTIAHQISYETWGQNYCSYWNSVEQGISKRKSQTTGRDYEEPSCYFTVSSRP